MIDHFLSKLCEVLSTVWGWLMFVVLLKIVFTTDYYSIFYR